MAFPRGPGTFPLHWRTQGLLVHTASAHWVDSQKGTVSLPSDHVTGARGKQRRRFVLALLRSGAAALGLGWDSHSGGACVESIHHGGWDLRRYRSGARVPVSLSRACPQ